METNKSPNYFQQDDVIYFKLNGRGLVNEIYAIVSVDKWPMVSKHKWYLGKSGYPICYELHKMSLHRFIFHLILGQKPPSNLYIDHIDRNKLNNTNGNLRLATPQENSFNRTTKTNKKGVKKSGGKYSTTITKDGITYSMDDIETEEEAIKMYNFLAEEFFGDFAAKNDVHDNN